MNSKLFLLVAFLFFMIPVLVVVTFGTYLLGFTETKRRLKAWWAAVKAEGKDLWETIMK